MIVSPRIQTVLHFDCSKTYSNSKLNTRKNDFESSLAMQIWTKWTCVGFDSRSSIFLNVNGVYINLKSTILCVGDCFELTC